MAAGFSFFAGESQNINNLNGSGLGFFGATFGSSVQVGLYQSSTFITDANGTINGGQVDNTTYIHPNSGTLNGVGPINLLNIPNHLATLNMRFTNDSAVKTQNAVFYVYDRINKNNNPSGVTCKVAEIIHPSFTQTDNLGSGDAAWITAYGSGVTVGLVASPGPSGTSINGVNTTATQHDWYVVISASPDSIGSKTYFGGYVECEYL